MRFAPGDDALLFASTVRDLLAKECPPEVVRAAWEPGAPAVPAELWGRLSEMGVLGALAPERVGGLGLDEVDLVLVLEEAGRAALPGPLADQAMVAVPALVEAGRDDDAARAALGDVVVAVGAGPTALWLDGAGLALLERDGTVYAVDPASITATPRSSVDRSRRAVDVTWSVGTPLLGADAALASDRGALAAAAQLVGLGAAMLDLTVAYAKERRQFGAPIGSFQAVKHHLADALIGLEHARPAVLRAADSVARRRPERSRDVSMAKVLAERAAGRAGRAALQCHGAIGYSFEHDLHLWLKRTWALAAAWGGTALHRERVARAVVDAPTD
ncbi:MAG: acyl-CoA dehydrogenase [Acidimicrobiales bacterium]|nr:acyl-CoA dehydrogenase [Acidimicrobiales bacterium]